jgi:hypothetical protein
MGRERRLRMWAAIEEEFGEPLAETIQGLREQGNSWRTVAGALDVSLGTLVKWRRALGLLLAKDCKVRDPSSYPERTPTDEKARALGYRDAREAVLDLRLKQGKTLKAAAAVLGVHYTTIYLYTPREVRGSIYNRSEGYLAQRRAWAREMTERSVAARRRGKRWSFADNDPIFQPGGAQNE